MNSGIKIMVLASVVIVALVLQVVLIIADRNDTPGKAAVEFTKAYFKQNECMVYRLCNDILDDNGSDVVRDYIDRVADEARANGFKPSWMRMGLSHTELDVKMVDDNTAEVHLTASSMRSVNPLYGVVSKVFLLGEFYDVEETLTVVKEEKGWKVCGQPFELIDG
jgi:hypothetical protein